MSAAHVTDTAAICLSHTNRPTNNKPTFTTCYCIKDTLATGNIESLTGRLINVLGTRLVATPARTLLVDNRDVFLDHARAVAAVRDQMRERVAKLARRRG